MRRTDSPRRRFVLASLAATSALALGGCASFGGNVRGSFSCSAPDGICAPSSVIDDRALTLLSADPSEAASPADLRTERRAPRLRSADLQPVRPAPPAAARTQEKVLRIVFQPFIDEHGRLHEASAVHAVVSRGDWEAQALGDRSSPPAFGSGPQISLADAVDRFDAPIGDTVTADPFAPDPAAIAAARARAADPIESIRSDVRARLAPLSAKPILPASAAKPLAPPAAAPMSPTPASTRAGGSPPALATPTGPLAGSALGSASAAQGSSAGATAVARVKADPRYEARAIGAAPSAKDQAAHAATPPAPARAIKAESFPAAVEEDR